MKLIVLLLLALMILNIMFGDGAILLQISDAFQYNSILSYIFTAVGSVLFTLILMSVLFENFKLFKRPDEGLTDPESGESLMSKPPSILETPEDDLFIEDLD